MRTGLWAMALLAIALASGAEAQEQEFVTGDGTRFTLGSTNGLPDRAETDEVTFESAGFDVSTADPPSITDRFSFLFKGGDQPVRVRIEDVTLPTPVVIVDAAVPDDLDGAGFRRSRYEVQASPCPIARGEPCSAWMFGAQTHRLYRVTLTYDGRGTVTLLQAEPFQMGTFIARLGDRIPDRGAAAQQP